MARRTPRTITAAYLERVTAHYLERYSANRAHLRRLLMQRVRRSAAHHGAEDGTEEALREAGAALVDAELDRLERVGLVNDDQFARDKARAMMRRGSSTRKVQATLRARGLSTDAVEAALERLREDLGDPELKAACTFARKRRLGPWRRADADRDQRRKEMARLGRAGFGFGLARRIVEAEDPEELLESV